MVEDKNLTEKVSKLSSTTKLSQHSSGFLSNCDNARNVQHLIAAEHSKERRPFQFDNQRDGDNNNCNDNNSAAQKTQAVTVIGADQTNNHNSLNANSAIDSRACYKPEKKVIKIERKYKQTTAAEKDKGEEKMSEKFRGKKRKIYSIHKIF